MRQEIKTSSKRFAAKKLTVGRKSIVILTEDERIDIPLPDGVNEGMVLPPAGTVLWDVQVSMNAQADTLYGFYPSKGTYIVQFLSFSRKSDEKDPTPRVQPGGERRRRDGTGKFFMPDRRVFTALLKILAGDFQGCVIPLTVDYIFERDMDGSCFLKGGKKAIGLVENLLTLCGFDVANEQIRYSENILPLLEQMLTERADDSIFQVSMKDGWVDDASPLPAGFKFSKTKTAENPWSGDLEEEEEEPEPEPEPKKPARSNKVAVEEEDWEDEEEEELPKKSKRNIF